MNESQKHESITIPTESNCDSVIANKNDNKVILNL